MPAREIVEDAERDIAKLLVECRRLEAKRLEASVAAASPHGLSLGGREEQPAVTAAPNLSSTLQELD